MIKKRKISQLLLVTLLLSFSFGCSQIKKTHALFFYISGANIESNLGRASSLIDQLVAMDKPNNVKIYGLAGGSTNWENPQIKDHETTLFEIKDHQLEVKSSKASNMGEARTLKDFINFTDQVEADNKSLVIWGHGSPYGICNDSTYRNDALFYNEVKEGLKDSYFDFIIFNCCFSANVDLMSFIQNNAKYAIASEDFLPTSGFDYSSLVSTLSNYSLTPYEQGKKIIDDTFKKYDNSSLTLSLISLDKIKEASSLINDMFFFIKKDPNPFYKNIYEASSINQIGRDFFDIDILKSYDEKHLLETLVPYQVKGKHLDYHGLYLYFKEKLNSQDLSMYVNNAYYDHYFSLLTKRLNLSENNYLKFVPSYVSEECLYKIKVPNVEYLSSYAYVLTDQEDHFIKKDNTYLEGIINQDASLDLLLKEDALFAFTLGDLTLPSILISSQDDIITKTNTYQTSILLNDIETEMIFNLYQDQGKEVISIQNLSQKDEHDNLVDQTLKVGDVIETNSKKLIYDNQKITKTKLDNPKYQIIIEDVYGNVYQDKSNHKNY